MEEMDVQTRIKGEGYHRLYANNMKVSMTDFDVTLTFGQITEAAEEAVIEEQVSVTLPRELGKVVAKLLADNIKAYEEAES